MRDQGLKTVLMAGDALADKEFASITGPAAEGVLFTFGPDPRNKPTAKAIVDKFKAKNIDPEGYTLYTYAAFQVWTQAAAKANTTDAKKVAAAIKAGSWDTVLGKISFDAKGDITVIDYVVYKWDAKGNYAELSTKPARNRSPTHVDRKPAPTGRAFCFSPLCQPILPSAGNVSSSQKLAVVIDAGEERDAGQDQQHAHRLLDADADACGSALRNAANGSTANAASRNGMPSPSE